MSAPTRRRYTGRRTDPDSPLSHDRGYTANPLYLLTITDTERGGERQIRFLWVERYHKFNRPLMARVEEGAQLIRLGSASVLLQTVGRFEYRLCLLDDGRQDNG